MKIDTSNSPWTNEKKVKRNNAILKLKAKGCSYLFIAKAFGISKARVGQIVAWDRKKS